jgi:hypothetical protein
LIVQERNCRSTLEIDDNVISFSAIEQYADFNLFKFQTAVAPGLAAGNTAAATLQSLRARGTTRLNRGCSIDSVDMSTKPPVRRGGMEVAPHKYLWQYQFMPATPAPLQGRWTISAQLDSPDNTNQIPIDKI